MATDKYTCNKSAQDWQLYSFPGYEHLAESEAAAKIMSEALTGLVRQAKKRLQNESDLSEHKLAANIRDQMYEVMSRLSSTGAMDTEPQCVLRSELKRAFGLDRYTLDR